MTTEWSLRNVLVWNSMDVCTMADKEGQTILRKKFRITFHFFRWANHRLYLEVNDTNKIPEVRNTVFYRQGFHKYFPRIYNKKTYSIHFIKMYETRWTEKKAINVLTNFQGTEKKAINDLTNFQGMFPVYLMVRPIWF